jgi:anti-anti-sigma factor
VTQDGRLGVRDDAHEGYHTLALAGELDAATAPVLESTIERLCEQGAREIVLDLHELSFIDSSGLRLILTGKKRCERDGCEFALTRPRPAAQRLFELTGLIERLSFRGRALADRIVRRPAGAGRATVDHSRPDFEADLDLNLDAPRSARSFVRELLRTTVWEHASDVVMLLTSELVSPVVQQGTSVFMEAGELRVWLRAEVVRVELGVRGDLLSWPREPSGPRYEETVLAGLADRWSIETGGETARVWFEVDRQALLDRHPSEGAPVRDSVGGASAEAPRG